MADTDAYAVQTLNGLIEITLDSAHGYAKAASLARNPSFRSLFEKRADARQALVEALQKAVQALGGEAVDHGSLLGPAHRALLTLLDKTAGGTDRAVIDEVARGESFIHGRFEHLAEDPGLPADISGSLRAAAETIGEACGEIETLQQQFHGTATGDGPPESSSNKEGAKAQNGQLQIE